MIEGALGNCCESNSFISCAMSTLKSTLGKARNFEGSAFRQVKFFRKHVNFVSGKNGSGKSAILQAIQLCFGHTAFDTGRGKNLQGFIKTVMPGDLLSVAVEWSVTRGSSTERRQ